MADDDRFLRQHQLRARRTLAGPDGIATSVMVNETESPLAWLRLRKIIDGVQFDAGERLRRDFTLAGIQPRMTIDLTAPIIANARGQTRQPLLSDTVLAAKQRFSAAMRAAGPGLNDLLFDVCCHLRGLEAVERRNCWPTRSAKVVLGIALDRLAEHYGLNVTGRAGLRAWQKEGSSELSSG